MNLRGRSKGLLIVFLVLSLVALAVGSCAPKEDDGAENVITFYLTGDLSGMFGSAIASTVAGATDVMRYWDEKDWIPGASYELVWRDSGGDLARAKTIASDFMSREPKPIAIFYAGTGEAEQAYPIATEKEVIVYSWGITTDLMYPPGWAFGLYGQYFDYYAAWLKYVSETWDYEAMGRNPRIGNISWDYAVFLDLFDVEGIYAYAEDINVDIILPVEAVPIFAVDITAVISRLADKGADYLYLAVSGNTIPLGANNLAALGLTGVVGLGGLGGVDPVSWPALTGGNIDGLTSVVNVLPFVESLVPEIITAFNSYGRTPDDQQTGYIAMWNMGWALLAAYQTVIEEQGWEYVNGATVKAALETLDVNTLASRLNYTPERHYPTWALVVGIVNGQGVVVSDWFEVVDMLTYGD